MARQIHLKPRRTGETPRLECSAFPRGEENKMSSSYVKER